MKRSAIIETLKAPIRIVLGLTDSLRVVNEQSYYPEENRKNKLSRLQDSLGWLIKYKEANRFYNLYGFDLKKNAGKEVSYVDYLSFAHDRDEKNQLMELNSQVILLRDYSWSTVRLYYSMYYATRAFLACHGIAFMRAERRLFYIKAQANEYFIRCEDTTDHKATMKILFKLFKKSDKLLSNNIDGSFVNEWMMDRREEVNYKDMDFHDPIAPDFWQNIDSLLKTRTLESLIDMLVRDNWVYCFQGDYGILGIPTKRLMLTTEAIRQSGKSINISHDKMQFIESFAKDLENLTKVELIIWK